MNPRRSGLKRLALALLLAAPLALPLAISPPAAADPRSEGRIEEIAERLGLTADQRQVVSDLLYQYSLRRIDLQAERDRAGLELRQLLIAPTLDERAIQAALDRLTRAEAGLRRARVELMIALRKALTYEQWTQLEELYLRQEERRPPGPPGAPSP